MQKNNMPEWVTIQEAVGLANELTSTKLKNRDIYRHALYGSIYLSIYFQSPIVLQKVRMSDHKVKFRSAKNSFIHRLCFLDKNCFLSERNLIVSTKGEYISPAQQIIDTMLTGYEYVLVQRLLARSLSIPLPITGANDINYGISVIQSGEMFQVFEKLTWQERIKQQVLRLPKNISSGIYKKNSLHGVYDYNQKGYFPIHDLPKDSCFVIRYAELEKLLNMPTIGKISPISATRISSPLSRLFWLACKHNEAISPLIRQPYKLLSIFEQWASDEGITDRLSGDTLKTALKRGSPTSVSASN
ncbi:hypothetical protein [Acerihabitans arboris]|uniref:Uncharacterized protein n=1 Tax=Acerihabitans arboris TaxID=2691583 RepID=A0A845SMY8_9GAMM|nr:hypothetical protein [Acerihabitans arboris]NDL64316.1 hypothetical protein [Acerihabitans arboris]